MTFPAILVFSLGLVLLAIAVVAYVAHPRQYIRILSGGFAIGVFVSGILVVLFLVLIGAIA